MASVSFNPAARTDTTLTIRPLAGRSAQAAQAQFAAQQTPGTRSQAAEITRPGYQTSRDGDTATFQTDRATDTPAASNTRSTAGAPTLNQGIDLYA